LQIPDIHNDLQWACGRLFQLSLVGIDGDGLIALQLPYDLLAASADIQDVPLSAKVIEGEFLLFEVVDGIVPRLWVVVGH
jgi:hypothetical protein